MNLFSCNVGVFIPKFREGKKKKKKGQVKISQ